MLQAIPQAPRARAPRFDVGQSLLVASKTIGTAVAYNLATQNISKSGMLLSWEHSTPVPFSENTILELTIDPELSFLDEAVNCLGKVVRKETSIRDGQKTTKFGIRIVQIDHSDLDSWELCIGDLAIKASDKVSDTTPLVEPEKEAEHMKKKYRHAS